MKNTEEEFREKFEIAKKKSVVQLLFKSGRLINEKAILRVRKRLNLPLLRPTHMSLLPYIDFDGIHLTLLAEKAGVTKQAVGRLITELEEMGVVERLLDPGDGRAKLIRFSDGSKEFFSGGLTVLNEIEEELSRRIGAEQMQSLHENLISILEQLEN